MSKSFLTCRHPFFLSAKVYFNLHAFAWMLNHQKYWYFLLKTLWHEKCLSQLWILSFFINIYHHNHITAKLRMLFAMTFAERSFAKTQIVTNARALIWVEPHRSVAEQIKHEVATFSPIAKRVQTPWEADKLMSCEWSRKISSVKRLWFRVKFHFKWTSKHYHNFVVILY